MEKQYVERVMWETVRQDCGYPKSDQNEGFIYGLYLTDFECEGDIIDVQWFKTSEERESCIKENNFIVIFQD